MAKDVVNPIQTDASDADVIARAHRCPELFAAIFDRHHLAVHAYAARRAGQDAADDLLNEVFLVAFKERTAFDPDAASALPWLYGIAGNVIKRRWRTLATAARHAEASARQSPAWTESPEDRVADEVDSARAWAIVRSHVDELADGDREALLLFAWEELSYPEIAVAMGIPVGTVRSRIHRARGLLRASLDRTMEVQS